MNAVVTSSTVRGAEMNVARHNAGLISPLNPKGSSAPTTTAIL